MYDACDTVCHAVLRLLIKTRSVHCVVVEKSKQQQNAQVLTQSPKLNGKQCQCGFVKDGFFRHFGYFSTEPFGHF